MLLLICLFFTVMRIFFCQYSIGKTTCMSSWCRTSFIYKSIPASYTNCTYISQHLEISAFVLWKKEIWHIAMSIVARKFFGEIVYMVRCDQLQWSMSRLKTLNIARYYFQCHGSCYENHSGNKTALLTWADRWIFYRPTTIYKTYSHYIIFSIISS